jgi:orotidine-5'-phosphate decarboxylase
MTFKDKLLLTARKNRSWLCVGLDPDIDKLPKHLSGDLNGMAEFLKQIIDSTKDIVCAYKPNNAFYEVFGVDGYALLQEIIDYIAGEIPVILDAKRADIGNTSRMYAQAAFDQLGADAITVNPYLGRDSLQPFLDYKDKGVIILCVTSNPSSDDFQKQMLATADGLSKKLYQLVVQKSLEWNQNQNIGLVVGATSPTELGEVRALVGEQMSLLIPGVGAQGGDLENSLKAGGNKTGELAIINVSRAVLYASTGQDYAAQAREAALALVSQMRTLNK